MISVTSSRKGIVEVECLRNTLKYARAKSVLHVTLVDNQTNATIMGKRELRYRRMTRGFLYNSLKRQRQGVKLTKRAVFGG